MLSRRSSFARGVVAIVVACILVLTPALSAGYGAASAEPDAFLVSSTLRSGMRVIAERRPNLARTTIALYYGVGTEDEPSESPGLAHLVEHLMFRGRSSISETKSYRTELNALHVYANAYTRPAFTGYVEVIQPSQLVSVLTLERQRMDHVEVSADDIEVEANIIRREFAETVAPNFAASVAWYWIPRAWRTDGASVDHTFGDVARLAHTRADVIAAFHSRYYQPCNAVLVITGDLMPSAAVASAERVFGSARGEGRCRFAPRRDLMLEGPVQFNAPERAAAVVFPVPQAGSRQFIALLVLDRILLSRLASTPGASQLSSVKSTINPLGSAFALKGDIRYALWVLGDAADAGALQLRVANSLTKISSLGVSDTEVHRAQRGLMSALADDLETVATATELHAIRLGYSGERGSPYDDISSVTPKSVAAVATWLLSGPAAKIDFRPASQ
jgi:zinc protease